MDWISILAIGLVSIVYPVVLCVTVWSLPVYVIVSYFLWMACIVGWIGIGEKKKVSQYILPVIILTLIFTFIYASGYSETEFEEDTIFILITPAFSTPILCFLGYKIAEHRIERKQKQLNNWTHSINYCYEKKIEGTDKVISVIQEVYSEEKSIENLLFLLDSCEKTNLQQSFVQRASKSHRELLPKVRDIISEYSLKADIENKSLGKILDEMIKLKDDYKENIYDGIYPLDCYRSIKRKYDALYQRK